MFQRLKFKPVIFIPVAAVVLALLISVFKGDGYEVPGEPVTSAQDVDAEEVHLIVPDLSLGDSEFDEVVSLQGLRVEAPDGKEYLVLGAISTPQNGCMALLNQFGRKIPCKEFLGWDGAKLQISMVSEVKN